MTFTALGCYNEQKQATPARENVRREWKNLGKLDEKGNFFHAITLWHLKDL